MELTKKDIEAIRHKIKQKNTVFSDKKFLDSLFLPSNIIGRKEEAETLLTHIDSARGIKS